MKDAAAIVLGTTRARMNGEKPLIKAPTINETSVRSFNISHTDWNQDNDQGRVDADVKLVGRLLAEFASHPLGDSRLEMSKEQPNHDEA